MRRDCANQICAGRIKIDCGKLSRAAAGWSKLTREIRIDLSNSMLKGEFPRKKNFPRLFNSSKLPLDLARAASHFMVMRQSYHSIIKPARDGVFIGWVEEVPGTVTAGRSLDECRRNLKDALELMVETHRHEARLALDTSCLQEPIEIEVADSSPRLMVNRNIPRDEADLVPADDELQTVA